MIPAYDVVVVGAGPIGITTACTLKAINQNLRICVIDKRPEPQRNHGLHINADSVNKIQRLLDATLFDHQLRNWGIDKRQPCASPENIKILKATFEGWRNNFIRTSQIEIELADIAGKMDITVLRDKDLAITEKNFSQLCRSDDNQNETDVSNKLREIFNNACVVIGADGAHSIVRKVVMLDNFSYQEDLRHIVELKFQTKGQLEYRGYKEATKDVVAHNRLTFETTSKDQSKPTKPVTLHIFVDKPTYDSLRIEVEEGKLKGVFGNSWNLKELEVLAATDQKIQAVYVQIMDYLKDVSLRHGDCQSEQISTLSLSVYKSANSVKKHHDKYVLLVGDAESGLILERGFNKGLKGAAFCAQAVNRVFLNNDFDRNDMPEQFVNYETEMQKIFIKEKNLALIKNMVLDKVETSLASSMQVKQRVGEITEISNSYKQSISSIIENKAFKIADFGNTSTQALSFTKTNAIKPVTKDISKQSVLSCTAEDNSDSDAERPTSDCTLL